MQHLEEIKIELLQYAHQLVCSTTDTRSSTLETNNEHSGKPSNWFRTHDVIQCSCKNNFLEIISLLRLTSYFYSLMKKFTIFDSILVDLNNLHCHALIQSYEYTGVS